MSWIIALFVSALTVLAKLHMTFPAALIVVAAICAAVAGLAWLIATGIGRLLEPEPRYRTTTAPEWSTA
jgi:hypothetical protein